MPFTATHVAAVVPLSKVWRRDIPFSALAIGSMMPDFPLFFPWGPDYWQMHTITGAWSGCLPIGMACFLLFQCLVKAPMLAALPDCLQRRTTSIAYPALQPRIGFFVWVAAGVLMGAYTHILWDAFTHRQRWGTEQFPVLTETWLTWNGHSVPGYSVLQYGSSVVFLPMLAGLVIAWLWRQTPQDLATYPRMWSGWRVAVWMGGAAIGVINVLRVTRIVGLNGGTSLAFHLVTTTGAILALFLVAYAVVFHLFTAGNYLVRIETRSV